MLKPPRVSVRAKALALLSRRDYSQHELKQRLLQAGYDAEEVSASLAALIDAGWQSDQRFAEALVRRRADRGLYGTRRIRAELAQHGIDDACLDDQGSLNHEQEYERAMQWLCKRWSAERFNRAGTEAKAAMIQALMARGFEYDVAKAVVAEVIQKLTTQVTKSSISTES